MGFLSRLFGKGNNPLTEILQQGGTIIDVRTPGEFSMGNVEGSINIPVDQVIHKLKKIKKMKTPLVLCCASGIRSASATQLLKNNNIAEVYNGGRWSKVDRLVRR